MFIKITLGLIIFGAIIALLIKKGVIKTGNKEFKRKYSEAQINEWLANPPKSTEIRTGIREEEIRVVNQINSYPEKRKQLTPYHKKLKMIIVPKHNRPSI